MRAWWIAAEVSATAIFHDDVEDASIAVDVTVLISYNMVVVVFQDAAGYHGLG